MNGSALSRRHLIAGALVSAELPSMIKAARKPDRSKPNVVVILFDDLGLHDLGFLGAADLKTPHVDRLCAEGTRFTNWFRCASITLV